MLGLAGWIGWIAISSRTFSQVAGMVFVGDDFEAAVSAGFSAADGVVVAAFGVGGEPMWTAAAWASQAPWLVRVWVGGRHAVLVERWLGGGWLVFA